MEYMLWLSGEPRVKLLKAIACQSYVEIVSKVEFMFYVFLFHWLLREAEEIYVIG